MKFWHHLVPSEGALLKLILKPSLLQMVMRDHRVRWMDFVCDSSLNYGLAVCVLFYSLWSWSEDRYRKPKKNQQFIYSISLFHFICIFIDPKQNKFVWKKKFGGKFIQLYLHISLVVPFVEVRFISSLKFLFENLCHRHHYAKKMSINNNSFPSFMCSYGVLCLNDGSFFIFSFFFKYWMVNIQRWFHFVPSLRFLHFVKRDFQ